jgi:hypothetical protein
MVEAALEYARAGFPVFPAHTVTDGGSCSCRKMECSSPGKHPRNPGGFRNATTDETTIIKWWEKWPDSNIGIATGSCIATTGKSLVVLDVDPRNGGDESLKALLRSVGELPRTPVVSSGGGGKHIYFVYPKERVRSFLLAPGLELKADGTCVIAPPSDHKSGNQYQWQIPLEVGLAPVPTWLEKIIAEHEQGRTGRESASEDSTIIPEGERSKTLTSMAGTMRRRGFGQDAIEAALLAENQETCEPPLSATEVENIAASVAKYRPESKFPVPVPTKEREIGNGPIRVSQLNEPGPRNWVIKNLIPDGALTILYGDGGLGKSYIALAIATSVSGGLLFLGENIEQRNVLYVDADLDQDEFARRAFRVARGFGLTCPPDGLYYFQLKSSLYREEVQRKLEEIVTQKQVGFAVIDSLTVASGGLDVNDASSVIEVLKGIAPLGTVLAIDHVAKPQFGTDPTSRRPFGSTFKHNLARSQIQIQSSGGVIKLLPNKANFSALAAPIYLVPTFTDREIKYKLADATEVREADSEIRAVDRIAKALAGHMDGVTPKDLAAEIGLMEKTVRNHLTALAQQGRAKSLGDGRWTVVPDPSSYIGKGNRESEPEAVQSISYYQVPTPVDLASR